ncbi:MAG: riboflavin synthase [Saprospiraceae bacterium]
MFTGIIKSVGIIKSIAKKGSNLNLTIQSKLSNSLKVDESVAHNGVCLTIVNKTSTTHVVNIIHESLQKTNFNLCKVGDLVNLERSLKLNDLLGGHFVQGHVDCTASIISLANKDGSIEIGLKIKKKYAGLIIPQGSICINGISLTIAEIKLNLIKVCIIPYTFKYTNIHKLITGDKVNIEFDVVGKYISRNAQLKSAIKK